MDRAAVAKVLARAEPFDILEPAQRDSLVAAARVETWPLHQYVFRQGQPSLGRLFVVAEGLVEITVAAESGAESVVGVRRPYDFFGETVVLSEQCYPASARVGQPLTAVCIERRDLERLIHANTALAGFFTALLAERMRLLWADLSTTRAGEAYACVAEPLFRRRVGDLMSSPAVTCGIDDPVTAAAQTMSARNFGALVVIGRDGRACGMLSARHLVRHLVADRRYPVEQCRVGQVCSRQLVTIGPEAYLGQALVTLLRHEVEQILVVDRQQPVGLVTLTDLVRSRSTGHLLLAQDIESRQSVAQLAQTGQAVDRVLETLLEEQATVSDILEVMSTLHERLTRRVIALAEERMRREGFGPPPVAYCWINMGSAARREQTLRTDQDNAIVYADPPADKASETRDYFQRLGQVVVADLESCGFALCPGKVMANQPDWCRSLSRWTAAVAEWVGSPTPEHVRRLTILLDCRPVWGNQALAGALWEQIFQAFQQSLGASHVLSNDDRQFSAPLSLLGSIVTEKSGPHKDQINLKTRALVHIINALRLMAVNHGISEPSTLGRLRQLAAAGVLSKDDAAYYQAAFETLLLLRIRIDAQQAARGQKPDHYLAPASLAPRERLLFKDALSAVVRLQKQIQKTYSVFWVHFFS
ncbi:MAG TPA: CBS domain-containing protein [Desulfobacteraceae bacterium]|nr:CBS domain-containing protein [Deltaproteobacteria bacterium]HDI60375.1 CBS domain-containing protein [Desulfobacteraceae bacterium]